MTQIIDRRKNSHGKSTENRQRFLKRVKGVIKEQLPKIIANRKIKDMGASGGRVKVSRNRGITEPIFRHGDGGKRDYVIPGNKDFVPGDTIPKPRSGTGSSRGRGGSNEGQWEDDFIIELSQQELLDYLFEDLELPNLVQKELTSMTETKSKHAGFNKDGSPNKLSVIRSFKQSLSRRIPAKSSIEKKITELEQQIIAFNNETIATIKEKKFTEKDEQIFIEDRDIMLLQNGWFAQIEKLKKKLTNIPFFDPIDLRFKQTVQYEIPTTHATMIMIMDNSGSMGLKEKTIARKFFFLLYAFLSKQYEKIDLRFISHTTSAHEMDEEEFFNTQESGGTVVSTALELTADIIEKDLMNKTNIYICQISDGDNFSDDNGLCEFILREDIMPFIQYFAYVQVDNYHPEESGHQLTISNYLGFDKGLWESYKKIANEFENFQIQRVFEESDIYSVFKKLFEKKK